MNRNLLYVIIAVLVIAIAVIGWKYYQDQHTASLDISVGDGGVSIDAN